MAGYLRARLGADVRIQDCAVTLSVEEVMNFGDAYYECSASELETGRTHDGYLLARLLVLETQMDLVFGGDR